MFAASRITFIHPLIRWIFFYKLQSVPLIKLKFYDGPFKCKSPQSECWVLIFVTPLRIQPEEYLQITGSNLFSWSLQLDRNLLTEFSLSYIKPQLYKVHCWELFKTESIWITLNAITPLNVWYCFLLNMIFAWSNKRNETKLMTKW